MRSSVESNGGCALHFTALPVAQPATNHEYNTNLEDIHECSTNLEDLPVEVLRQISGHLGTKQLKALTQLSKGLNEVAVELLWYQPDFIKSEVPKEGTGVQVEDLAEMRHLPIRILETKRLAPFSKSQSAKNEKRIGSNFACLLDKMDGLQGVIVNHLRKHSFYQIQAFSRHIVALHFDALKGILDRNSFGWAARYFNDLCDAEFPKLKQLVIGDYHNCDYKLRDLERLNALLPITTLFTKCISHRDEDNFNFYENREETTTLPFLRQIRQLECLVVDGSSRNPIGLDTLAEIPKLPHLKKLMIKKPLTGQMIAQLEGAVHIRVCLPFMLGWIGKTGYGYPRPDSVEAAKIRTDRMAALLKLPNPKSVCVHYPHSPYQQPGRDCGKHMIRCAELRQLVLSEGSNRMTLEVSTDFLSCAYAEEEELVQLLCKANLRKLYVRVSSCPYSQLNQSSQYKRRIELITKYIPSSLIHKFDDEIN